MAKLSKIFRLSEEAVAILDSQDNATKFVEDLILRQSETISKGEALILDRLDELSVFSRLPDDGESHPIHPDIKNNSGASPIQLETTSEDTPSERSQWKSAGERKVQITPPCCFLPKQCDHDIWDMDSGQCINPKTGVVKEV